MRNRYTKPNMRPMRRLSALLLAITVCAPVALAPAQQTASAQNQGQTALQQFQQLDDSWSIALVNKDQYALDNLLAPSFVDISAAAQVNSRNQYIADALAGEPAPLLSVEQKVVSVRVVSDVAIVEGTYMLKVRGGGEHVRDERGIYTHIYARSHNTWACVNAQRTQVVDALDTGKTSAKKADRKSSAPLPFHIPLIH
jgi:hypothetical protein